MKRNRKLRAASAAPGPGPLRRWWRGLDGKVRRAAIMGVLQAVLIAALVGGGAYGLLLLRRHVLVQPTFSQSAATLDLVDRPAWMPDRLVQDIRLELMGGDDQAVWTFDPEVVRQVGQAAAACPWISVVEDIHVERAAASPDDLKGSAGRIVVRAQYRKPVAILLDERQREHPIDAQAVLLPAGQAGELMQGLPRIVKQAAGAPRVGQPWPGPDVQSALAVLRLLEGKPYYRELVEVDVDNRRDAWAGGQSQIVLLAAHEQARTRINFGALPAGDLPAVGEPSLERKVGYLDGWHKMNRGRLTGPDLLDLRYPELMVHPRDYLSSLGTSPS